MLKEESEFVQTNDFKIFESKKTKGKIKSWNIEIIMDIK